MNISFKGTKMKITPPIRDYAEKKIRGLKNLLSGIDFEIEAFIELGKTTGKSAKGQVYRAEAMLTLPGKLLRATQEDFDIYVAIDKVRNEMKIEIEKYKGRYESRSKKEARFFKVLKNLQAGSWDLREGEALLPPGMPKEQQLPEQKRGKKSAVKTSKSKNE